MPTHKILGGIVLVLFGFYLVQDPTGAAGLIRHIVTGLARFAAALTGGA